MNDINLIWGPVLILLGLVFISKTLFGFAIPFIRIFVAAFIMYLGINILSDKLGYQHKYIFSFSNLEAHVTDIKNSSDSHVTAFSNNIIDLSDINITTPPARIKVTTLCGNSLIKLNPTIPTHINTTNILSSTVLPDGSSANDKNSHSYFSALQEEPLLIIDVTTVLGKVTLQEYSNNTCKLLQKQLI